MPNTFKVAGSPVWLGPRGPQETRGEVQTGASAGRGPRRQGPGPDGCSSFGPTARHRRNLCNVVPPSFSCFRR